jgi:hypothetical protein
MSSDSSVQLQCPFYDSFYNITVDEFNCDFFKQGCDCPPVTPDPDIAGIGVRQQAFSVIHLMLTGKDRW